MRSWWRGCLAGVVGGAVGTLVLNGFQKALLAGTRVGEDKLRGRHPYADQQQALLEDFNQARGRTAAVAMGAVGERLRRADRERAVAVTEFAFGMVCAGVYGAVAEHVPAVTAGFGAAYGAVLFTGASEVVLPAMGWVTAPKDRTPVQHAGGLAGNVVYGVVTEGVRRLLR